MTDYKSMFEQAVRTLAAIDEALGIGDDGCGDPDQTLTAIAELKAAKVGAGETALEVHGTVFFKDNHQYRSQLRFPIADGAYELVKIENPDMTHPLFHVAGQCADGSFANGAGRYLEAKNVRPAES